MEYRYILEEINQEMLLKYQGKFKEEKMEILHSSGLPTSRRF